MSSSDNLKVYGALLGVQVIFGIHYLTTDFVVEYIDPLAWSALRIFSAGCIMLFLFRDSIKVLPSNYYEWRFVILLAVSGIVVNTACFSIGLKYTTPAHSSLINCMIPVLTLTFAASMGKESLSKFQKIALPIAMAGALILLEVDNFQLSSEYVIGDIFILINATGFALFLVLSRSVIDKYSSQGLSVLVLFIGGLIMLPLGAPSAYSMGVDGWTSVPTTVWIAAVYTILFATIIAYSLNYFALSKVNSSQVALFIYLQPLIATSISIWIGRDEASLRLFISGLLILFGLALSTMDNSKSSSKIVQ